MHRFFLRETTRDLHHDLDARISLLDLGDADGYAAFLRIHAAALLPLEAALEAGNVVTSFEAWDRHRRSDALTSDLRQCGIEAETAPMAPIEGRGMQMGVLYVLEGSRLGGRLLERQAQGQAGRNAFLTHGAGMPLWQDFLTRLENVPDAPEARRELAAGARLAFGQYSAAADRIVPAMQRSPSGAVWSSAN